MQTNWAGSPVGDVTRTEFFDDRGELYYVEWGKYPLRNNTSSGMVPSSGISGPGRAPLGDVMRMAYYDNLGQPYWVEWRACPSAITVNQPEDPTNIEAVVGSVLLEASVM